MKNLQAVYNEIVDILKDSDVILNITPPRPYLTRMDGDKEIERLYFDEAWKYKNFK